MNSGTKMIMILVVTVILLLLVFTFTFQVDGTRDLCVVTQFGEIHRIVDGEKDPGLGFKWLYPIQRLYRYDFRDHVLKTSLDQISIAESYSLTAKVSCTWKIDKEKPENVKKFHRSKASGESIEAIVEKIRSQLASDMQAVMGRRPMSELVNNDPGKMKIKEIEQEIKSKLNNSVSRDFGIKITSLGIHSLGLPEKTSKNVTDAMIEDQKRKASRYESEGEAEATAIKSRANAARTKILELAGKEAAKIRAKGIEESAKSYLSFQKDPEFALFLRELDALRNTLKKRVVFFLDANGLPVLKRFHGKSDGR